jgi:MoxR-like ATPase
VQSALLEVMQEKQITISGETFKVAAPYLVMATQNPIEQEGTYPLPEAQTDRFMMKIKIHYPSKEEEKLILQRMGTTAPKPIPKGILTPEFILEARRLVNDVYVDEKVENYILDLVCATRDPKKYHLEIDGWLTYGASPRATIALKLAARAHAFLSGRAFVTPYDVQQVGVDILCHRLRRSYEAEAQEISTEKIIQILFNTIPAP